MTNKKSYGPVFSDEEVLDFHESPTPGKITITSSKPMASQRDLSMAYSPGVAVPVKEIAEDSSKSYDYTSKGNMVAVISNGTAILGLGNLGAAASKPVMEGKAVLFKRFADINSIDIEVEEEDPDAFIECVKRIGHSFGGINLEDIKSPESFLIEEKLRKSLNIPVFHDDQHGTAIIAAAALMNACDLTNRKLRDVKVVLSGAGAAGLSVLNLIQKLGVKKENTIALDRHGVIYKGRKEEVDQWKKKHEIETEKRTLSDALKGADCFIGLSIGGIVTKEMVASMAKNPIIFAMANPDPEILPEHVKEVRLDAIMATGRSDYPNQVNNVLGFPYIFRGALDVRARTINDEMKIAAAKALAKLAREDVPDEVAAAYHGSRPKYGSEYIIPAPFDPRLISYIPPFVAQAAMDSGVAQKPIEDMSIYKKALARRLDPTAAFVQRVQGIVKSKKKIVVFAEGEEPSVIRAAHGFVNNGLGEAILIGREDRVLDNFKLLGLRNQNFKILNAKLSDQNPEFVEYLYARLNRKGYLKRDVQRLVNHDRNVFSACMVALGHADGVVTGITRNYDIALKDISLVIDPKPNSRLIGLSAVLSKGKTLFIADTNITEFPDSEGLADIAESAAIAVEKFGFTPRVAFLSYSTFGNPMGNRAKVMRKTVEILDKRNVDFEYEGEMSADVALDPAHKLVYPFSRLSEPANILIMPAIHSASIASKLLQSVGNATVIGPILVGFEKPVQICRLGSPVGDIVMMATIASSGLGI